MERGTTTIQLYRTLDRSFQPSETGTEVRLGTRAVGINQENIFLRKEVHPRDLLLICLLIWVRRKRSIASILGNLGIKFKRALLKDTKAMKLIINYPLIVCLTHVILINMRMFMGFSIKISVILKI